MASIGLLEAFSTYKNLDGFLYPNPVSNPDHLVHCDNTPRYTTEYSIMANDKEYFESHISQCIDENGMLNRYPVSQGQNGESEEVDDYYAVLHGCAYFNNTDFPKRFLKAVLKFKGSLNNANPRVWTGSSFLIRQPQLLCAMLAAAYPKNVFVKILALPLYIYSALVILTSCIGAPTSDTDSRTLAFHLIHTVAPVSYLCYFACLVWYKRLYKDYPTGMKGVAALYYQPTNNPYSSYWVNS